MALPAPTHILLHDLNRIVAGYQVEPQLVFQRGLRWINIWKLQHNPEARRLAILGESHGGQRDLLQLADTQGWLEESIRVAHAVNTARVDGAARAAAAAHSILLMKKDWWQLDHSSPEVQIIVTGMLLQVYTNTTYIEMEAHVASRSEWYYWAAMCLEHSPVALAIVAANVNNVYWWALCHNTAPEALAIVLANLDKVCWWALCCNTAPLALDIVAVNLEKVIWVALCRNTAPEAMTIVAANLNMAVWAELSGNPAARALLAANRDKIDWWVMSSNPVLFDMDMPRYRAEVEAVALELSRYTLEPACYFL